MKSITRFTTNYHTLYPKEAERHHILAECPDGSQIRPEHRVAGTEGRPLCVECERIRDGRVATDAVRARITSAGVR